MTGKEIQTLHGHGYRFIAPVEVWDEAPPAALLTETRPRAGATPTATPPAAAPAAVADAVTPAVPHVTGEYKPVSVLCGALVDAPALAATLGPEGLYRWLRKVWEVAQAVMQQYAGTLIPHASGEGFMAVFGAPVAQEDHARRAVLAALDLHECLRQSLGHRGLALGVGIHSGLAVVGSLGPDPQGLGLVVGAPAQGALRLRQRAAPGTLLVSAATYHLVQA